MAITQSQVTGSPLAAQARQIGSGRSAPAGGFGGEQDPGDVGAERLGRL